MRLNCLGEKVPGSLCDESRVESNFSITLFYHTNNRSSRLVKNKNYFFFWNLSWFSLLGVQHNRPGLGSLGSSWLKKRKGCLTRRWGKNGCITLALFDVGCRPSLGPHCFWVCEAETQRQKSSWACACCPTCTQNKKTAHLPPLLIVRTPGDAMKWELDLNIGKRL